MDTTFNPSNEDAFVTKLSPDGMSLVYSTYIGGTGSNGLFQLGDTAYSMDVDAFGSVYIVGETHSTDFPVTPDAYQTSRGGGLADGYVVKLSPGGPLTRAGFQPRTPAPRYGTRGAGAAHRVITLVGSLAEGFGHERLVRGQRHDISGSEAARRADRAFERRPSLDSRERIAAWVADPDVPQDESHARH